jgi:hypothetical protein
VGGPATLNGISPEILYLLEPAQGLFTPEGNIVCCVTGERPTETRGRRPIRTTHYINRATSEALRFLIRIATSNRDGSSMSEKWNKRRRQMTLRESDDRIVPQKLEVQSGGRKPGNTGAGKAVGISGNLERTPSVLSDGPAVLNRPDCGSPVVTGSTSSRIPAIPARTPTCGSIGWLSDSPVCKGLPAEVWEPDAGKRHVRI